MSDIKPSQDIRSVTDLKRNTREILDQLHETGRPIYLTVNGRADSVLMDVSTFERYTQAARIAHLLAEAERDIDEGRTLDAHAFIRELRHAEKEVAG